MQSVFFVEMHFEFHFSLGRSCHPYSCLYMFVTASVLPNNASQLCVYLLECLSVQVYGIVYFMVDVHHLGF